MRDRAQYLDNGKGCIILLMLFSHTLSGTGIIRTYISHFHMQFFFLVCGILLYMKYGEETVTKVQLLSAFRKRLSQIGVPYFAFCLVLALFYSGLNLIVKQPLQFDHYLRRTLMLQGIDSLWFLSVYFFSEFLLLIFLCIRNGRKIAIGVSIAIVIILSVLSHSMPSQQLLRLLVKSLIGFTFVCLGYELSRLKLFDRISVLLSLVLLICGATLSKVNGFAAIGSLEIGNGFLFFLSAAFTGSAILALLKKVESAGAHLPGLSLFGQNTIVILCTNNLLIETIRLADHKLTGDFLLKTGLAGSLLFTALLILIEIPVIKLASGPFAPMFGKQAKKG